MIKQLGLPTYFMTLSCADLRWDELIEIIGKLNRTPYTKIEIREMDYVTRAKILQSNPVLLMRHFQFRVETFFKEIVVDGPMGKVIYHAIRVEFQVRGSPHVHCLLWVKGAPILSHENKDEYVNFVDSLVKCELPDKDDDPELFDLVRTYQTHSHSKSCRKYKNIPCRYSFGRFFCDKTYIAEPLDHKLEEEEKNNILKFRKEILDQVKEYIDNNLDPKYNNLYDPEKENFRPPKSIDEILNELNIDSNDYYKCLQMSPDENFQIHFKRSPNSCFINNYFIEGLKAWEANIDIQPVLDYYKAVSYMCAYISKSEDESSEAMKQAAKEAYESGHSAAEKMKSIAKAYRTNREMSVQEATAVILPQIWLRKTSPQVIFANSNLPDDRYRIFKTEEEILNMADDETNVFKRNMLDRYIDRPNSSFKNGKFAIIDSICYAEFLRNYTLDKKPNENDENDYQPQVLEEVIEDEDTNLLPKVVPLMSSRERLKLRKKKCVLRYHVPNKTTKPEAYAHHMLLMFYPFRSESELNATPSGTYTEKLSQPGVIDIINLNKQKCEPYGQMVDDAFAYFSENNGRNLDPQGEQENNDVAEEIEDLQSEEDVDNGEYLGGETTNIPLNSLLSDDELHERIRSLNIKQREIFDFVNAWTRKKLKSLSGKNTAPDPFHIFLTGSAGTGKSHVLTTIRHYLQKALSYGSTDKNKDRLLMLAPTGVAAINIDGATIHSTLGISPNEFGKCVTKLSDKHRHDLRKRFSELQIIIIDEISMVSNRFFLHIHQRLCEIFGCTTDKPFAGISVMVCGDFFQLPPIKCGPVYAPFHDPMLSLDNLWTNFKIAELTEIMRQRGDQTFIDVLNNVRIGEITEVDEEILKSRFVQKDDPNYPLNAVHIWAENALVNQHNMDMLQNIDDVPYELICDDTLPDNISDDILQKIYERSQMSTGGLARKLIIKKGARVMVTANIDTDDKLCNGSMGTIQHLKFDRESNLKTIYLKMDRDDAGLKTMNKDNFGRIQRLVPIKRVDADIKIRENSPSSPKIKRHQFPLMLSWACTVHKVQGLTFVEVVFSFDLLRQRYFKDGQAYTAMSRVTSLAGLHFTGKFDKKHLRSDDRAKEEYARMRATVPLTTMPKKFVPDAESLTIALINTRSVSKHAIDIMSDLTLAQVDLLCLTETQIQSSPSDSLLDTMKPFRVEFNNLSDHKFSNTAVGYQQPTSLLYSDCYPGISLYSFS